jgi:hypothetical protein
MKLYLFNFLLLVSAYCFAGSSNTSAVKSGEEFFSKENLQRHLQFLGSDSLEGRGTGTPGGNLAARYLSDEFKKLHLLSPRNADDYFQHVPMHGSITLPSSKMIITGEKETVSLAAGTDYLLYRGGEQTFTPAFVQMVFAGYGIVAPEYDYNDYQSVDVEGKIVVLLEGEPVSGNPGYFDGSRPTIYSYPDSKQRIAISRGARGTIIIPSNHNWDILKQGFSFEDITLAYSVTSNLNLLINPAIVDVLFKDALYSYEEIFRMHLQNRILSFPLKTYLSFRGDFKERDFLSPNAAGILEGSDPELKDTYLIISAHYDHLGIGPAINGDSIYNGVFDNAAGVAALLEIARKFSSAEIPPKRSVLFLLLTGEENGLLGSTYYVENPLVPLYKTIANINIDGIAMFDRFKSVIGIGSEYSTLCDYLKAAADENNLTIGSIPPEFEDYESFTKSDQMAFATGGIPSLLIYEGADYENLSKQEGLEKLINYSTKIYHTPFDDLSQPMNFDAALQHINIIYDLSCKLLQSESEPGWLPGAPFINARLRSQAEKK